MATAASRTTTWVPAIGFAGALGALFLAPGLLVSAEGARTGTDLLREAASGSRAWTSPHLVALLAAAAAAVTGLVALRLPALARWMALAGFVATVAFLSRSGSSPTVPYYAALGGFGLAFLGSRVPGCGPGG